MWFNIKWFFINIFCYSYEKKTCNNKKINIPKINHKNIPKIK